MATERPNNHQAEQPKQPIQGGSEFEKRVRRLAHNMWEWEGKPESSEDADIDRDSCVDFFAY